MKDIQAIFFDFDGVILESVEAKGWAFGKLFEDFPEHIDEIIAFHNANGGMSRFDKVRHIYKNILHKPLSEEKLRQLCKKFSDIVYNLIIKCDFVPGAIDFLRKYQKRILFYIVSATPQEEIQKIIKAKRLSGYFNGVFGSPTSKSAWARKIIEEQNLDPERVLFVGDAISDYKAAKDNGIFFVARVRDFGNDIFKDRKVDIKIANLFDLDTFIQK